MKRLGFWLAVAGVAVGANFAVEAAATQFPNSGVRRFATILHKG